MTKKSARAIGNEGEEIAVAFLEAKNYRILQRNYTFEKAEIDIIAEHQGIIVFTEVKLRKNTAFGYPEEFVDEQKIQFIYRAAEGWAYEHKLTDSSMRFDVISIILPPGGKPKIKHLEDAFR